MKKILLVIFVLCSQTAHAQEWITEEVLKQLSEVRQELKTLQDEVRSLKAQLTQNKPTQAKVKKVAAVDIEGAPSIGSDKATIGIIEFSDYQCPYCQRHFKQTLPSIEKNYIETNKIKYVMKQFPLGFHSKAKGASVAALCAENLKPHSYWDAHKSIFGGKTSLNEASYLALAKTLSIDKEQYKTCLSNPEMSQKVDSDMAEGSAVGVTGTPAFLIGEIVDGKLVNGRLLTGARPISSFSQVLDELL